MSLFWLILAILHIIFNLDWSPGYLLGRRDSMIWAFRVRPAPRGRTLCDIDRVHNNSELFNHVSKMGGPGGAKLDRLLLKIIGLFAPCQDFIIFDM